MNDSFSGKVALVTGGSRGIGKAIAMALAERGAEVILVGRNLDSLQAAEKEIEDRGGKATGLACHVGKMDQIQRLFQEIQGHFGRLDMLVNNAGTNPYFGPVEDAEEWAFDKTFAVNLKGPFFLSAGAVKLMRETGAGAIVNVASIVALNPPKGQSLYAMTKAAMVSMTRSFARECGPDIRVNAVLPGVVDTQLAEALTQSKRVNELLTLTPSGRYGQPDEIVGGVLYLLSDAASYTTGTTLVMDGGTSISGF
ncbi:MAG: glucose 1-dehydrogenase [Xanthomonadales bacterium]|nr:glucose 1-dehydrogenase [Xanthomonadales bacterium]